MPDNKTTFISYLKQSIADNTLVKVSCGNYRGKEPELKKILAKPILLKNEEVLSFTFRYQTKDIVKNYLIESSIEMISDYIGVFAFRSAMIFTTRANYQLEFSKKGKSIIRILAATEDTVASKEHDKIKNRPLGTINKPYLQKLGLVSQTGTIYKSAQNKYKQINHYIELLRPLLDQLQNRPITKIVDMGSGKGYLTFALYDYLNNILDKKSSVIGVEYRTDLVAICNDIAKEADFDHLHFVQGSIDSFDQYGIHVLIALHACDTATDDAIYKGIMSNAELIVVAPCCHKQIRREIQQSKKYTELDYLTKHGIFMERQAEMVTDGLRALILEYYGYKTKVFEFISDEHTPKNVLIVGTKGSDLSDIEKKEIHDKIIRSKAFFGINYHHLEKKLNL